MVIVPPVTRWMMQTLMETVGPNLNEIKPDISRVLMAVTNGIGVMPAYQGQLSDEEIEAVATYVVESTN